MPDYDVEAMARSLTAAALDLVAINGEADEGVSDEDHARWNLVHSALEVRDEDRQHLIDAQDPGDVDAVILDILEPVQQAAVTAIAKVAYVAADWARVEYGTGAHDRLLSDLRERLH